MSRKFLIAISVVASIVVGLWIWTLAIPKNVINIGGSASVDPIMQRATTKYNKKGTAKNSFIYSSTGSTSGIQNLKSGVYDIGFISKEVPEDFGDVTDLTKTDFEKSETDFVTWFEDQEAGYYDVNFANDAIVFIYNIEGTGFEPFVNLFTLAVGDAGLVNKEDNCLHLIYEHDSQRELIKWQVLAERLMEDNNLKGQPLWERRLQEVKNKNIDVTPYASTPGSGTRTSFENLTGVVPGQAVNQYGNNGSIFAQISASNGAFGFVNLAFAQEIAKNNKFQQLKTVIIQNEAGDLTWNIGAGETPTTGEEYPLSRPFIAIFYNDPHKKTLNQILSFIYWFATSEDLKHDYEEEGLIQLMTDNNFWLNSLVKRRGNG